MIDKPDQLNQDVEKWLQSTSTEIVQEHEEKF
jgi:hypothetical protein